jgi:hypothetical protein
LLGARAEAIGESSAVVSVEDVPRPNLGIGDIGSAPRQ